LILTFNLLDITPVDEMYQWKTNEYQPTSVNWFNGDDLTDYDDVKQQREIAIYQSKIFGITLNSKYCFFLKHLVKNSI